MGVARLSSSSQAGLLAEVDRLGTNLLTVEERDRAWAGVRAAPREAPARITHLDNVQLVAHTGLVKDEKVYRSSMMGQLGGIQVRAASLNLLSLLNTGVARATGSTRAPPASRWRCWARRPPAAGHRPRPRICGSGWEASGSMSRAFWSPRAGARHRQQRLNRLRDAERYLGYVSWVGAELTAGPPSSIYVRAAIDQVARVQSRLARTASPRHRMGEGEPAVRRAHRPAAARQGVRQLFLGLGVVSLFVGAVGVASIMIISVLERRSEIGLGAPWVRRSARSDAVPR